MMKYDFDTEVSRKGTNSVKWEFMQGGEGESAAHWEQTDKFWGENRTLPMWVADMDFLCPRPVINALIKRAEHGIYGYTERTETYYRAVVNWMGKRHGWKITPEWICTIPGVIPALNMIVRTFASPAGGVLVQPPVYYPFFNAIKNNGCRLFFNPLIYEGHSYRMDFIDLEKRTGDPDIKMAILCNPHNPVGRVWTREELIRFGEICLKNSILVVSDEIHGDLIYQGYRFTPFASISEEFADNTITCTGASKTFNMAGLQTSNIIISNAKLRTMFERTLLSNGIFGAGAFGVVALEAAYTHGEEWLEQVLSYIEGNLRCLEEYIANHIPEITVIRPEGTYLVWLDCRRLGLDKWALKRLMLEEAKVYLDEGFIFGPEGEGFERINIACPRSILMDALQRIERVIDRRRRKG